MNNDRPQSPWGRGFRQPPPQLRDTRSQQLRDLRDMEARSRSGSPASFPTPAPNAQLQAAFNNIQQLRADRQAAPYSHSDQDQQTNQGSQQVFNSQNQSNPSVMSHLQDQHGPRLGFPGQQRQSPIQQQHQPAQTSGLGLKRFNGRDSPFKVPLGLANDGPQKLQALPQRPWLQPNQMLLQQSQNTPQQVDLQHPEEWERIGHPETRNKQSPHTHGQRQASVQPGQHSSVRSTTPFTTGKRRPREDDDVDDIEYEAALTMTDLGRGFVELEGGKRMKTQQMQNVGKARPGQQPQQRQQMQPTEAPKSQQKKLQVSEPTANRPIAPKPAALQQSVPVQFPSGQTSNIPPANIQQGARFLSPQGQIEQQTVAAASQDPRAIQHHSQVLQQQTQHVEVVIQQNRSPHPNPVPNVQPPPHQQPPNPWRQQLSPAQQRGISRVAAMYDYVLKVDKNGNRFFRAVPKQEQPRIKAESNQDDSAGPAPPPTRAASVESVLSLGQAAAEGAIPPPKKRGRPRKADTPARESPAPVSPSSETSALRARSLTPSDPSAAPQKKVGRPRKVVTGEPSNQQPTTKGGKPKKNQIEQALQRLPSPDFTNDDQEMQLISTAIESMGGNIVTPGQTGPAGVPLQRMVATTEELGSSQQRLAPPTGVSSNQSMGLSSSVAQPVPNAGFSTSPVYLQHLNPRAQSPASISASSVSSYAKLPMPPMPAAYKRPESGSHNSQELLRLQMPPAYQRPEGVAPNATDARQGLAQQSSAPKQGLAPPETPSLLDQPQEHRSPSPPVPNATRPAPVVRIIPPTPQKLTDIKASDQISNGNNNLPTHSQPAAHVVESLQVPGQGQYPAQQKISIEQALAQPILVQQQAPAEQLLPVQPQVSTQQQLPVQQEVTVQQHVPPTHHQVSRSRTPAQMQGTGSATEVTLDEIRSEAEEQMGEMPDSNFSITRPRPQPPINQSIHDAFLQQQLAALEEENRATARTYNSNAYARASLERSVSPQASAPRSQPSRPAQPRARTPQPQQAGAPQEQQARASQGQQARASHGQQASAIQRQQARATQGQQASQPQARAPQGQQASQPQGSQPQGQQARQPQEQKARKKQGKQARPPQGEQALPSHQEAHPSQKQQQKQMAANPPQQQQPRVAPQQSQQKLQAASAPPPRPSQKDEYMDPLLKLQLENEAAELAEEARREALLEEEFLKSGKKRRKPKAKKPPKDPFKGFRKYARLGKVKNIEDISFDLDGGILGDGGLSNDIGEQIDASFFDDDDDIDAFDDTELELHETVTTGIEQPKQIQSHHITPSHSPVQSTIQIEQQKQDIGTPTPKNMLAQVPAVMEQPKQTFRSNVTANPISGSLPEQLSKSVGQQGQLNASNAITTPAFIGSAAQVPLIVEQFKDAIPRNFPAGSGSRNTSADIMKEGAGHKSDFTQTAGQTLQAQVSQRPVLKRGRNDEEESSASHTTDMKKHKTGKETTMDAELSTSLAEFIPPKPAVETIARPILDLNAMNQAARRVEEPVAPRNWEPYCNSGNPNSAISRYAAQKRIEEQEIVLEQHEIEAIERVRKRQEKKKLEEQQRLLEKQQKLEEQKRLEEEKKKRREVRYIAGYPVPGERSPTPETDEADLSDDEKYERQTKKRVELRRLKQDLQRIKEEEDFYAFQDGIIEEREYIEDAGKRAEEAAQKFAKLFGKDALDQLRKDNEGVNDIMLFHDDVWADIQKYSEYKKLGRYGNSKGLKRILPRWTIFEPLALEDLARTSIRRAPRAPVVEFGDSQADGVLNMKACMF